MDNAEFTLTIQDALKRPLFQKATIIAGEKGLNRRVRWVHILEISNFDTLVHGEEMILSTGVGLHQHVTSKSDYLQNLIKLGVSCLCIELGKYFDSVTAEMIEIANMHKFPIIVFNETVRFIDITHDLHSVIINHHYKMLQQLEEVSREFTRLTLTSMGILNILKLLHEKTKAQVLFLPEQGHVRAHPYISDKGQEEIVIKLKQEIINSRDSQLNNPPIHLSINNATALLQPVGAMGQTWAYLVLIVEELEPKEFEILVLDRAALSIAQDLFRKRYIEERKMHSEQRLVADLIHLRIHNEEEIRSQLGLNTFKNFNHYRVCLIEYSNIQDTSMSKNEIESLQTQYSLLIRTVFEKFGFRAIMTTGNLQIIVIAIDLDKTSQKHRLEKVILSIKNMCANNQLEIDWEIGIGGSYQKLLDASQSYNEAQYVIKLKNIIHNLEHPFYEDIGIYRLLFQLENNNLMQQFIQDYLGPIINTDQDKGSNLLQTLNVYLNHDGSIKASADELFIVRQTLYHRLEKIKELIGDGFMFSAEKKIAIQVALRGYQLLQSSNNISINV